MVRCTYLFESCVAFFHVIFPKTRWLIACDAQHSRRSFALGGGVSFLSERTPYVRNLKKRGWGYRYPRGKSTKPGRTRKLVVRPRMLLVRMPKTPQNGESPIGEIYEQAFRKKRKEGSSWGENEAPHRKRSLTNR